MLQNTTDKTIVALFDDAASARRAEQNLAAAGISGSGVQTISGSATGLVSRLASAGVPNDDAHAYAESVRRGGTLLNLSVSGSQADEAVRILEGETLVDIDSRRQSYHSEGWTSFDENAGPYTGASAAVTGSGISGAADALRGTDRGMVGREEHIPIVEESLAVGKRAVQKGAVRIHSRVVERPVEETVTLRDETINVERRAVTGGTGEIPADAFQERTIELSETDEEAVVSKTAAVTGEVVVNKQVEERTETIRDTVRKTDVDVEGDLNPLNDTTKRRI